MALSSGNPITYNWAIKQDSNIVNHVLHISATKKFCDDLWHCRETIRALTMHHLRISDRDSCTVLPGSKWISGSFNVCIPVEVKSGNTCKKFMFRCPMPHKHAESRFPGTVDEKLRCEVGNYVWMQSECSDVPIAFLHGFGFSDHRHFTHVNQRPVHIRYKRSLRRHIANCSRQTALLSHYTPNPTDRKLPTAYLLLQHIGPETGTMLSDVWDDRQKDPTHRKRLFEGIARIMLSLARVPQPKIGALRFNDDCTVTLTNRPLTCTVMMLENEGAPRTIQQNDTYSCTDAYVANMLTLHDNHFLANPSAVDDEKECHSQMATRTLLWAISHHFIKRERSNGPFSLQFTDFHASNIVVDGDTTVRCLLDLEWICALPSEMLAFPYRLTEYAIDEIHDHLDDFDQIRLQFMLQFEKEEKKMSQKHSYSLATIMQETWTSKGIWFWYCLESVNAVLWIFDDHIRPRFSSYILSKDEELLSRFWCDDSDKVAKKKVAEYMSYQTQLQRMLAV